MPSFYFNDLGETVHKLLQRKVVISIHFSGNDLAHIFRNYSPSARFEVMYCMGVGSLLDSGLRSEFGISGEKRMANGAPYHVPIRNTASVVIRKPFSGWRFSTPPIHEWVYWMSISRQANGRVITTSTPPPAARLRPLLAT